MLAARPMVTPAELRDALRDHDDLELRIMVAQAWELKRAGSPYFLDACQAIVDWHERRALRWYEAGAVPA
jgi:hypothetical protein